jgi:hypothetical protein
LDLQLSILFCLTLVIHLIATLAYSVRIAGTRTGKITISLTLFNILVLISRSSNAFQGPLLAKRIEHNLLQNATAQAVTDFRWLLLATTIATLVGAFLTPTSQRLFGYAVNAFSRYRSVSRLVQRGFTRNGLRYLKRSACLPSKANLLSLQADRGVSTRVLTLNLVATAVSTVGVFAALYAGYLNPELRVTASFLSGVVNSLATIFMAIFIDPSLSLLTDDVTEGRVSEGVFRRSVVWLVGSRLAGTVLAQVLLIPSAILIGHFARILPS